LIKSRTLVGMRIVYALPRFLGKRRGARSATTAPYRHDDRQRLSMMIADGSWEAPERRHVGAYSVSGTQAVQAKFAPVPDFPHARVSERCDAARACSRRRLGRRGPWRR
jgi:hypothetical protein